LQLSNSFTTERIYISDISGNFGQKFLSALVSLPFTKKELKAETKKRALSPCAIKEWFHKRHCDLQVSKLSLQNFPQKQRKEFTSNGYKTVERTSSFNTTIMVLLPGLKK